jgi:hypothetical protein
MSRSSPRQLFDGSFSSKKKEKKSPKYKKMLNGIGKGQATLTLKIIYVAL